MTAFTVAPTDLVERLDAEFYQPVFVEAHKRLRKHLPTRSFDSVWKDSNRIYIGIAGFETIADADAYTPYLRPADIGDYGEIDYNHLPYCFRSWLTEYGVKGCGRPGDLIVEVKGNTRRVAVLTERLPKNCLVSGSAYRIAVDEAAADPYFLQSFLLSDLGQTLKRRLTSNTTISYIDPESFRQLPIPVVDLPVQRAIGNKLRKADTLRRMAGDKFVSASSEVDQLFGPAEWNHRQPFGWMRSSDFDTSRLDAWFYQASYREMAQQLRKRSNLVPVSSIARPISNSVNFKKCPDTHFDYFEIADLDSDSGMIVSKPVAITDAPSRAKYRVFPGDILVSTVRPNRKAIALVPAIMSFAVCSSGFAALRCTATSLAHYLRGCLVNDIATAQLMRWNTGATYPAIDRDVPLQVLIPWPGEAEAQRLGKLFEDAATDLAEAQDLTISAITDTEGLIDRSLDSNVLLQAGEEISGWLKCNSSARGTF